MKPMKAPTFTFQPETIITATANEVSLVIEPARWIVAYSGTTNEATGLRIPILTAQRSVTGMVAVDARGIVEALRTVFGADALVKELTGR